MSGADGPTRVALAVAGVLGLGLLAAPAAAAPEDATTTPLTLEQAIATAIAENPTLAAEGVDAEAAAARFTQAVGADDVRIEGGITGASRRIDPVVGPFFQETARDAVGVNLGVFKPLSSGGRVGLELRQDVVDSTSRISQPGGALDLDATIYTPSLSLTIWQPLLRGRGVQVAHADRRRAIVARTIEELEHERRASSLARDVATAYWELAYADRELAIRESALRLAEEQLAITRAAVSAEQRPEIEALAVEQSIAAREEALLVARLARAERALELRLVLGLDPDDRHPFAAADPLDGPRRGAGGIDGDGALADALAFSPELRMLARQGEGARIDAEVAKSGLLPELDLFVRGGVVGNSDELGDAFEQAASFESYEVLAGLTFRLPVGNRVAEGRRDEARAHLRRVALDEDDVRGQITAAVQRAVDRVRTAEQRIEVARRAVTLAARNLELERGRWQVGSVTNFDVMERQDEQSAAEAVLSRAHADHAIALAVLVSLTGTSE